MFGSRYLHLADSNGSALLVFGWSVGFGGRGPSRTVLGGPAGLYMTGRISLARDLCQQDESR